MPALQTTFYGTLSVAYRLAGELTLALVHATTAMRMMEQYGRPEEGEQLILLAHAEALHATGAIADARTAIATAELRLLAIASKIRDPEWCRSYLEAIPENATTLALARVWRGSPLAS